MLAKACAALAIVGSAAAYVPPMMSLSANRREVIAGAGAAAVVAPLLRPTAAKAQDPQLLAPIITIFDHRGCTEHSNTEYYGPKSGDSNDEMCIKIKMAKVVIPADTAERVREASLSTMKPRNNVIFENN